MNKYFTLLFWLVSTAILSGQTLTTNGDATSIGMGSAGVVFKDLHSIWHNQAGLAYLQETAIGAYAEQHYLLTELQTLGAVAAYPTTSGTLGISINYIGLEQYKEQKIGLAYGRQLFDNLSIGGQILMLNTQIPEYGNKTLFTFEIGAIAKLLPQIDLGVHLFSPVRVELTELDEMPSILSLGLAYYPSEKVTITTEVEKDIDYEARVKAGIAYRLLEQLTLRTGIGTKPTTLHLGVGYELESGLSINVASSYHQVLGISPAIGLVYVVQNQSK